jgi:hypothetical protein
MTWYCTVLHCTALHVSALSDTYSRLLMRYRLSRIGLTAGTAHIRYPLSYLSSPLSLPVSHLLSYPSLSLLPLLSSSPISSPSPLISRRRRTRTRLGVRVRVRVSRERGQPSSGVSVNMTETEGWRAFTWQHCRSLLVKPFSHSLSFHRPFVPPHSFRSSSMVPFSPLCPFLSFPPFPLPVTPSPTISSLQYLTAISTHGRLIGHVSTLSHYQAMRAVLDRVQLQSSWLI